MEKVKNNTPPPPHQPPSSGDQLFYLLLTLTASTIVYKSFPKSLRGIATLGVASFGIYHSFGLRCDCIKRVASHIFGHSSDEDSLDGNSSGKSFESWNYWLPRIPYPWETFSQGHDYINPPPQIQTVGVDQEERQQKRPRDPQRTLEDPQRTPPPSPLPNISQIGGADQSQRQEKRRSKQ